MDLECIQIVVHFPARNLLPTATVSKEGTTEPVVAVIGHPVAGNPTQFALETALSSAHIDCRVISLDLSPQRIPIALAGMQAMRFRGVLLADNVRKSVSKCCPIQTTASDVESMCGPDVLQFDDLDPWSAPTTAGTLGPGVTLLNLQAEQWKASSDAFLKSHGLPDTAVTTIDVEQSAELIRQQLAERLDACQATDEPWGGVLHIVKADRMSDSPEDLEQQLQSIVKTLSEIDEASTTAPWQFMDLSQAWEPSVLLSWERFADECPHRCVSRLQLHAACLSELVERWFGTKIGNEVFHEAIDEYLAV